MFLCALQSVKAGEAEDAPEVSTRFEQDTDLYVMDIPPAIVEQVRDDVTDAITRVMVNPAGIKQVCQSQCLPSPCSTK